MCLLVLFFRCLPETPLFLAANRDEYHRRPAAPPEVRPASRSRAAFLAPRDEEAGGTWIGLNGTPAVAALTNRSELPPPGGAPSRGWICARALRAGDAAAMARAALEEGGRRSYGGFNLLAADRERAYLVSGGGGRVSCAGLPPGVHVLTNEGEWNTLPLPLSLSPGKARTREALLEKVLPFLRSHTPLVPGEAAPCKHHPDRGTRSSTVIALGSGPPLFLHAPGPPCTTPYRDHSPEAAELLKARAFQGEDRGSA